MGDVNKNNISYKIEVITHIIIIKLLF